MKKLFVVFAILSMLTVLFHFFNPLLAKEKNLELLEYDGWTVSSVSLDPQ